MRRGAVLGLGNVAIHGHLPGWLGRPDVQIVAAADARPSQRAECQARLPGARWYDSPEELLDREALDFVDVCTPPSSHAPLILRALDRGLHVLCEKPLVSAPDDLRRVAEAAAAGGQGAAHRAQLAPRADPRADRRAHPPGRDRPGAAHRLGDAADEAGGGRRWPPGELAGGSGGGGRRACCPTTAGTSSTSLPDWVGARPTSVASRLETRRHTSFAVEDTASVRLGFPGATVDILLTWAADERRNWVEVDGTEGRIELHDDTLVLKGRSGERRWPGLPALSDGSHHPDWFHKVAERFLAAVRREMRADGNLAEATLCAEIEHLARESSRRGGVELVWPRDPRGSAPMNRRPAGAAVRARRSADCRGGRGHRRPEITRIRWWPAFPSAGASPWPR